MERFMGNVTKNGIPDGEKQEAASAFTNTIKANSAKQKTNYEKSTPPKGLRGGTGEI